MSVCQLSFVLAAAVSECLVGFLAETGHPWQALSKIFKDSGAFKSAVSDTGLDWLSRDQSSAYDASNSEIAISSVPVPPMRSRPIWPRR